MPGLAGMVPGPAGQDAAAKLRGEGCQLGPQPSQRLLQLAAVTHHHTAPPVHAGQLLDLFRPLVGKEATAVHVSVEDIATIGELWSQLEIVAVRTGRTARTD